MVIINNQIRSEQEFINSLLNILKFNNNKNTIDKEKENKPKNNMSKYNIKNKKDNLNHIETNEQNKKRKSKMIELNLEEEINPKDKNFFLFLWRIREI